GEARRAFRADRDCRPPRTHQGPDGEPWHGRTTTEISGSTAASDSTQPVPVSLTICGSTRSFRLPPILRQISGLGSKARTLTAMPVSTAMPQCRCSRMFLAPVGVPDTGSTRPISCGSSADRATLRVPEAATAYSMIFGPSCRIRDFEHAGSLLEVIRELHQEPFDIEPAYRECPLWNLRNGHSNIC